MALSCADKAYREALKSFEEYLDNRKFQEIQRPSPLDDLCRLATETHGKYEADRKTIGFTERVSKVREALRPFDNLLLGVCKLAPKGGKLIWGTIQFTFQQAENTHAIFDPMFDFFEGIAVELAIIQTEINTFPDSRLVSTIAQEVFAVLLEFWIHAVKTYRTLWFGTFKTYSIRTRFAKLQASLHAKLLRLKHAAQAQPMFAYTNEDVNQVVLQFLAVEDAHSFKLLLAHPIGTERGLTARDKRSLLAVSAARTV